MYRPAPPGIIFTGIDPDLGAPVHSYCYRDTQDFEVMWVCEYEDEPGRVSATGRPPTLWWLWGENGRWQQRRGPPTHPQWYRVNEIASARKPIWVFETEEEAEQFMGAFAGELATTWSGGAQRINRVPWGSLSGRSVRFWGKADISGQARASEAARKLLETAKQVWLMPAGPDLDALVAERDLERIISMAQPVERAIQVGAPANEPEPRQKIENAAMRHRRWSLVLDHRGLPYLNVDNIVRALEAIEADGGVSLWFDELHCRVFGQWPGGKNIEWADHEMVALMRLLQGPYGGMPALHRGTVEDAVLLHAMRRPKNPYRDWFTSLQWDGVERLPSAFNRAWGVPLNDYTAACSRIFLMQVAKRVIKPGCQADYMIVFEGPTGCGKTTSLETLFGSEWVDTPSQPFGHKDFYQGLQGKICIEIAEFAGRSGAALDIMKADVTRKVDRFRIPYGRAPMNFPRRCVFAATTERDDWNADEMLTARRFPPVRCGTIDRDIIINEREQWFAEARARVERDECSWDLPHQQAVKEQLARVAQDALDDLVRGYLQRHSKTTVGEILECALGIEDRARWSRELQSRVQRVLRRMGWLPTRNASTRWWRAPPGWHAESNSGHPDEF